MNVKIISMDFDGTLLTSDKKVSERTIKCLNELKSKSYKIIGVTARNLSSVKNVLDVSLFDYIILNNGADVYYVSLDKVENISFLDQETVNKIYELCDPISYKIDFCTPFNYLMKTLRKSDARPFIKYINGLDEVTDSISRMNVYFDTDEELIKNQEIINNTFKNINTTKMLDTDNVNTRKWLSINPNDVDKLSTLKKICNDVKCTLDEVVFFGDGENDLSLIENVGVSVAMQNAIDIVKEKASFVTLSNDNDGIAEYLEKKFVLRRK